MSDTQIGPDGRRHPIGQVPTGDSEKVTAFRAVYGVPATGQVPVWNAARSRFEWATPAGGGGSGLGAPVVRKFPFTFDTPNLATGAVVYTPTVGDFLLDGWIDVHTAWDGITPFADIGPFVESMYGWFTQIYNRVDMSVANSSDWNVQSLEGLDVQRNAPGHASMVQGGAADLISWAYHIVSTGDGGYRIQMMSDTVAGAHLPGRFTTADPVKLVVSQDCTPTGGDPGSTQGSATLYLVTATPV